MSGVLAITYPERAYGYGDGNLAQTRRGRERCQGPVIQKVTGYSASVNRTSDGLITNQCQLKGDAL